VRSDWIFSRIQQLGCLISRFLTGLFDLYDVINEEAMFCTIQEAENKGKMDYGNKLNVDNGARKQGVIKDKK